MTATQTQETGPVDDAPIDDEVLRLAHAACCGPWEACYPIAMSITARLAPRADALIEREQVENILRSPGEYIEDLSNIRTHEELREVYVRHVSDRIMALLPRAPMPDVVELPDDYGPGYTIEHRPEFGYHYYIHFDSPEADVNQVIVGVNYFWRTVPFDVMRDMCVRTVAVIDAKAALGGE